MGIEEEEIDTTTHLIKLGDEGYLYPAPTPNEHVVELVESGKTHILLDLSGWDPVVDARPNVLVRLIEAVQSAGGSVFLVCPDEPVRRVFAITGLDEVLCVYDTREEAMAAIAAQAQET
jgi:anti-sigma B factor antagonist